MSPAGPERDRSDPALAPGEAAVDALMRDLGPPGSPLGDAGDWPQSLRAIVDVMIHSKFPMFLAWGEELTFLYNDAYAPILGDKHPAALGRPFEEVWAEIWPDVEPFVARALAGEASWLEDLPLLMLRHGYAEQTYFTFSYSPVRDEAGAVRGVFCACTETTAKVLAVREITAERQRLAELFASAPVFMALLSGPDHRFELANHAYGRLLGHRDVIGKTVREALPEVEGQGFFELLDSVYRTGEPFIGRQLPIGIQTRPDGPSEFAYLDFVYQPMRNADGSVTGIFVSGYDVTELKQAEDRLRLAQQAGGLGAFELYPATRTLAVTEEFCRIWGIPYAPVLSLDATLAAIHPDDRGRVLTAGARIDQNTLGSVEYRIIRPDTGEERWIARRGEAIKDATQDVLRFAGVIYDITDRRLSDDALRESEARQSFLLQLGDRLRGLASAAQVTEAASEAVGRQLKVPRVGYGEIDEAQEHVTVERDWTDGSIASLAGETRHLDVFGPAIIDRLRAGRTLRLDDVAADPVSAPYAAGYAGIGTRALLIVPLLKEGRFKAIFYLHDARPRHWADGDERLAQEVAERTWAAIETVRAEAALQRLNETLEAEVAERTLERDRMWRLSQDLFVVIAADGLIRAINPAVSALGYEPAELTGRRFLDFVHPEDGSRHATLKQARTMPLRDLETRLRAADGSWHWFAWSAVPSEGLIHAVGRDVTSEKVRAAELEQVQEALRQSQKLEAMGQLTGGVAHDFNNLLTPIIGSLDMLHRRGAGGEREQRLIGGALESADRAKTLVQRLLAFARRQPLQSTSVDLAALIGSMSDLIASTSGPRVRLVVEVGDDLPPVEADANQLEMAILNLAVNSRDAMPDGGQLTISARAVTIVEPGEPVAPGSYVQLCVADTGVGMDDATIARAVEPFFSTKGIGRGTGLGLSMVHGLASQLGGALTIRSKQGLGTSIELWLPTAAEPAVRSSSPAHEVRLGGAGRVLLVDDEDAVRASTADMLTDLGYAVEEVASAEEALQRLTRGDPPAIVVTDHLMPGMTGADLARHIRTQLPRLPVLLISGYADDHGVPADLPRLTKPFRQAELAAALAELDVALS